MMHENSRKAEAKLLFAQNSDLSYQSYAIKLKKRLVVNKICERNPISRSTQKWFHTGRHVYTSTRHLSFSCTICVFLVC